MSTRMKKNLYCLCLSVSIVVKEPLSQLQYHRVEYISRVVVLMREYASSMSQRTEAWESLDSTRVLSQL